MGDKQILWLAVRVEVEEQDDGIGEFDLDCTDECVMECPSEDCDCDNSNARHATECHEHHPDWSVAELDDEQLVEAVRKHLTSWPDVTELAHGSLSVPTRYSSSPWETHSWKVADVVEIGIP